MISPFSSLIPSLISVTVDAGGAGSTVAGAASEAERDRGYSRQGDACKERPQRGDAYNEDQGGERPSPGPLPPPGPAAAGDAREVTPPHPRFPRALPLAGQSRSWKVLCRQHSGQGRPSL
jgi:hypothetical protein